MDNSNEEQQKGLDSFSQESVNGSMPISTPPTHATQTPALDPFAALSQSFVPKRAISYLRVSTREQAERGGREEGFSIPAQREANKKKAQSMGAMVVKEFVERGVSGTTTNRPALRKMLQYLEAEAASVDYVIVHKIDRLARNRADDVELNRRFDELGIRLISTSENIDQSPGGLLLHGIMASIAEFYSKNLSNEVKKGMTEKVRSGGSVGRAPLGYLNTRDMSNGREIRTVTVDDQRAPLITWAFDQYATGEYGVRSLTAALVKRGLTTPQTSKLPEKPVDVRQVHQILTNRYYTGVVKYKGAEHPGNHTPLVNTDTFNRVQQILSSKINGERTIKHDHYLKSTLYCGQCGSRMIVQVATARNGEDYPYYSCLGRHSKRTSCDLRSITFYRVEELIQDLYGRLALRLAEAQWLEERLKGELSEMTSEVVEQRQSLASRKLDIERKQRKLLEAHYNDAIPMDMLRTEQQRLDAELTTTTRALAALDVDLEASERHITMAVALAQNAASAYRRAPDHVRRMLNQILFERIEVSMDPDDQHALRAVQAPPFADLYVAAGRTTTSSVLAHTDQEVEIQEDPRQIGGDLPSQTSFSRALVSNKSTMVGLTGLEPATP